MTEPAKICPACQTAYTGAACDLCATVQGTFARLRQQARRERTVPRPPRRTPWRSGVDASVPNGDRE